MTLPLEGITVADLSQVWAGPILTGILADMGAEIIRIESQAGTDAGRLPGRPASDLRRRLESNYFFRNRKYYITLNLASPRGGELAKEVIKGCDVVVENFAPRVMAKFGLTYEDLRKVKQDIIMISISAGGQTGPLKSLMGYGPSINSLAGTDSVIGYPGDEQLMANVWDADPTAGNMGAFAVLTALYHKKRTGQGQYIDLAFLETLGTLLGEGMMEYQMTGRVPAPRGNMHRTMAPHGFYPCAGDDKWVSIAVKTKEEWQAFRDAIGSPSWTADARFQDIASRLKHREELDACVGEWTSSRTPQEATEVLQRAGVAAAQALSVPELYDDPHDSYRRDTGHIEDSAGWEGKVAYGVQWRLSKTPGTVRRLSPGMGADNDRFFTDVLGLPTDEVRRLVEERVIY